MSARSSELPVAQASDTLPRPVWNFGRSLKRATSEWNPNFRHLRRLSEIPVAQAKYAQNLLLVSVARANAKRASSEEQPDFRHLTRSSEMLLA